jgi:hypothetical protein
MQILLLVVLNVVAVALPLIGLTKLAFRARRAYKEALERPRSREANIAISRGESIEMFSVSDLTRVGRAAVAQPFEAWKSVRWDFLFIGVGVVAGGVANVWSLFL